MHERSRYHRSWPMDHFWLSPQCFWLSLYNAHFNYSDFKAVSYGSIPRFQFECLCLIMRKYLNNARGFHWLFIMVIIGIAFYLPFLIFGAFPYNTKINSSSDEMGQLLEGFESVDFYAMSEYLTESPEENQREIHAFETWLGGKCRF